jgi:hypothetical protein
MLHLGCVAHQFAKWQVPPEKWACTPDAVSGSTGSAGGCPCRARLARRRNFPFCMQRDQQHEWPHFAYHLYIWHTAHRQVQRQPLI